MNFNRGGERMFKRVLAITLAAGMAVGLMGCGNNGSSKAASTEASAAAAAAEAQTGAAEAGAAQTGAKAEAAADLKAKQKGEKDQTGTSGSEVKAPEGFPDKDITLVNPYEAGGTSDIPARIYADYISGLMDGAMMNVTDVTGSGGAVGAQQVMSSPADGYTLLVAPAGYAMQYAKGSCEFTYEDFKPVNLFVTSYLGMAVNSASGITTYEELVQAAKDKPGELKFGVATGGLPMFCVLAMEKQEGIKFNIVDIGGTTLKAPELLSGRIDVMIDSLAGLSSYVDSGDFNILGLYADERFANYPDVPTFAELGYETNVMNQVFGIWAPKDTPDDVVAYLSSLFGAAAADEGVQKQLTDLTYSASYIPTEEYVDYLSKMYADFQEFAKELN